MISKKRNADFFDISKGCKVHVGSIFSFLKKYPVSGYGQKTMFFRGYSLHI